MFVPAIYRDADAALLRGVVDENPLALFATNGPVRPYVTHLPAVIRPGSCGDDLTGALLVCHLNRANPQWRALADGQQAVLTFDGAGGYVSPVCYPAGPAAPTWDFVSVEVTGRVRLLTGPEATLDAVRMTAEELERRFGAGWSVAGSIGHFRRILPGVGAFELLVEDVSSMFKLSQEQDSWIQENVIERFEGSGRGASRDLARTMRAHGRGLTADAARLGCPVPSADHQSAGH